MILAGEMESMESKRGKAGVPVPDSARIEVHSRLQKYVSRGGFKLEGALEDFGDLGTRTGLPGRWMRQPGDSPIACCSTEPHAFMPWT